MNKFTSAFAQPAGQAHKATALQSVQSSLYGRLRKRYGAGAGSAAWSLLRLVQRDHPDHAAARAALAALSVTDMAGLETVVTATTRAPAIVSNPTALALATSIGEALRALVRARSVPIEERRTSRLEELRASGVPHEKAIAQVFIELPDET